jgi:hypothetical protein
VSNAALPAARRRTLDQSEEWLNVLYYGEQGTGKTTALATLARHGRVIFVDAEGGLKARPLRKLGVPIDNIEPVVCSSFDQLQALYWDVKSRIEEDNDRPFGVMFDSTTEIQKILTEQQVSGRIHNARRKADLLGIEVDPAHANPFRTHLDDYGVMTEQMRLLLRRFRDLPCHVGFSALAKREVDETGGDGEGKAVLYRPALTPAFANDIRGYVDIVVATQVARDGRYIGFTKPIHRWLGKDRLNMLPPVMLDPTLDRILQVLEDKLTDVEVTYDAP